MSLPILNYKAPHTQHPPTSPPVISIFERFCYLAFGVVLPVVCFSLAAWDSSLLMGMEPEWQEGKWACVFFIPDPKAGYPLYPLLLYSMAALCCLVARPACECRLVVRLGIYSGCLLAAQYALIEAARIGGICAVGSAIICMMFLLGIMRVIDVLIAKYPQLFWIFAASIGLCVAVPLTLVYGAKWLGYIAGLLVIPAPAWTLAIYLRAVFYLRTVLQGEFPALDERRNLRLAWFSWIVSYVTGLVWAVQNALTLYAQLPTKQPRCFIATAAATGHPRLVRSSLARTVDGAIFPVNAQLRRLKCVEIALAATCPRTHRVIRLPYDTIGPPLARRITASPWLADVAYLTLKPVEWVCFGVLVAAVPRVGRLTRALW